MSHTDGQAGDKLHAGREGRETLCRNHETCGSCFQLNQTKEGTFADMEDAVNTVSVEVVPCTYRQPTQDQRSAGSIMWLEDFQSCQVRLTHTTQSVGLQYNIYNEESKYWKLF